jgi:hypothetical protein
MIGDEELVSVEDLYEDDDVVLMKSIYNKFPFSDILEYSVGLKNSDGDIEQIKTVGRKDI